MDHWLSCMLDCIYICVFLLSKNCFEKLARHLLDTLLFVKLFKPFPKRNLDTSSIRGGLIEKAHASLIAPRHLVDQSSLISCFWCFYSSTASRHMICRRCFSRHLLNKCLDTTSTPHLSRFTEGSI